MNNSKLYLKIILVAALLLPLIFIQSCKHDPPLVPNTGGNGGGGNGGGGTGGGGGGGGNGIPCDTNLIYFDQDILPILIASCTPTGLGEPCHSAADAEEGVILNNYNNVMATGEIDPNDPWDSDFAEVIFFETDPDKKMPLQPYVPPLTQAQLNLISQWLNQGANYLTCDPSLGACDTTNVSFLNDVMPIISGSCLGGCHAGSTPSYNINLTTYAGVNATVANNKLVGSISHLTGFFAMPKGAPQLSACDINTIKAWVNQGHTNN